MSQKIDRRRTILDWLVVAWVLSIILLILEFMHSSPGFPDVASNDSGPFYVCVVFFAGLQVAITVVALSNRRLTVWSIAAICLSLLILLPEILVFLLLLLLWWLAVPVAVLVALMLTIRLIRRRTSVKLKP